MARLTYTDIDTENIDVSIFCWCQTPTLLKNYLACPGTEHIRLFRLFTLIYVNILYI